MKVIVFGSTGTLGRQVVAQALSQGFSVTGFARHPDRVEQTDQPLSSVAGDVLDKSAVEKAVAGHDAVIVTLGAGMRGGVRAAGTANIIHAMRLHKVSRLVALSTLGAGDSRQHLNFFWRTIMFGMLLRRAMLDHEAQESIVRTSGLAWTIVRPAAFTDELASESCRHGNLEGIGKLALKVPRASVASFLLAQLTDDAYLGKTPALSC